MAAAKPIILVVDDEALVRFAAADILEQGGFAVEEAANAENAMRVMEARKNIRLLFTDIHLPGPYDGLELARRVRKRWANVRFIITSGRQQPDASEMPGEGYFLAKPYSDRDLLACATELIGRP
jgi:CheY-like chemotaxis protein